MPQRCRTVRRLAACVLAIALSADSRAFAQDRVQLNSISKVEIKGLNDQSLGFCLMA